MTNKVVNSINRFVNSNKYLQEVVDSIYIVGNLNEPVNDLDFIVIISSLNYIEVLNEFSDFSINIIKEEKVFTSIFPINKSQIITIDSMFIRNVISKGIKIR